MRYTRFTLAVALVAATTLSANSARAAPLFDFDSAFGLQDPTGMTFGYSFNVTSVITIDALGFFTSHPDGAKRAHTIALWNDTDPNNDLSTAVVSGSVGTSTSTDDADWSTAKNATGDPLGIYVYDPISPLDILPGFTYVLAASYWNGNPIPDLAAQVLIGDVILNSPDVNYLGGLLGFQSSAEIVFPNAPNGNNFGPTLRIATATVPIPEPLTLALVVVGLAGLRVRQRTHP